MKIMLLDDNYDNILSLEILIDEYIQKHNIDEDSVEIIFQTDAQKGLQILNSQDIDILFLDIMMPKMSGFEILKQIRQKNKTKPIVIMATALNDEDTKKEEKKLKANAYMVKPFSYKVVKIMLDRYMPLVNDDSFFDFDELEEFDGNVKFDKDAMLKLNKSHQKLPANEFLARYDESEFDEADIQDLEDSLNEMIFKLEDAQSLEENKYIIIDTFEVYHKFLIQFSEFEELYNVVFNILELIKTFDLDEVKNSKMFAKFLIAIANDLIEWERHVFIDKDTVDIFYINASLYNSHLQLDRLIKQI